MSSPLPLISAAGLTGAAPWTPPPAYRSPFFDAASLLRRRQQAEPAPQITFMPQDSFFASATHDNAVTHVAAVHAGSHWLLCSAREPTLRLAANLDKQTARQFATINDAYRHARLFAPKALKFDVR